MDEYQPDTEQVQHGKVVNEAGKRRAVEGIVTKVDDEGFAPVIAYIRCGVTKPLDVMEIA